MGDYEMLRFYVDGDAFDDGALPSATCTMSQA
jgi:hypothetical protein